MKINNQHLEALRQVQEQTSKTGAAKNAGVEDFAKALAQELGAAGVTADEAVSPRQVSLGELTAGMGITPAAAITRLTSASAQTTSRAGSRGAVLGSGIRVVLRRVTSSSPPP